MRCHHGMNPSFFNWTGRLPLRANLVERGRMFEVFNPDGTPTGQASPLRPDGWPDLSDRRWHGLRIFGDMGGTMPEVRVTDPLSPDGTFRSSTTGGHEDARVVQRGRDGLYLMWKDVERRPRAFDTSDTSVSGFHGPSIAHLRDWRPAAIRTLDLQLTNKIMDWSRGRVTKAEPLQATDRGMAIEHQVKLANLCGSILWWPAPARYSLTVPEYEDRLAEYLRVIRSLSEREPIVQLGNELWNDRLGPGAWLRGRATREGRRASDLAAEEIATLRRVGDRVFGPSGALGRRSWYLFVDGQLGDPSWMSRVLTALPPGTADMAGPAFYVGPLRADELAWERAGSVPTQAELRDSCFRRLVEAEEALRRHVGICEDHGVPYPAVYEAGQSLNAGFAAWRPAAIEAQASAWMGDLYRSIRVALDGARVSMSCWYSLMTRQDPTDARVDVFGLSGGLGEQDLPKTAAARGG